jgi:hypothetical protein
MSSAANQLAQRPRRDPPEIMQDRLRAYVFKTLKLTTAQMLRWNWLYQGRAWSDEGVVVTGVEIPADGDVPGYLVTVAEMERAPA